MSINYFLFIILCVCTIAFTLVLSALTRSSQVDKWCDED